MDRAWLTLVAVKWKEQVSSCKDPAFSRWGQRGCSREAPVSWRVRGAQECWGWAVLVLDLCALLTVLGEDAETLMLYSSIVTENL